MKLPISFINFVDKATQWVYRATGGWLGGQQLKYSMLLLQTTGRKSGKLRTHTLLYVRDGIGTSKPIPARMYRLVAGITR
jgi:hypothetical protein